MARRWVERDHPRHPGGSERGGRFRERVGSGGWAARLNAMLGGHRGATERQIRRAGGRSDLGDTSAEDLRRALAQSDADYARGLSPRDAAIRAEDVAMITDPNMGGMTSGQAMAIRLESLGGMERARRAYRGLSAGQQGAIQANLGVESADLARRVGIGGPGGLGPGDVDRGVEQRILDRLYPEEARVRLRAKWAEIDAAAEGNQSTVESPDWAGGLSGTPGGYQPRRAPDGDYGDPDNQEAWEYEVRRLLHERGYDPNEVDTEVEGFGQEYQEWWDDPYGYVDELIIEGVLDTMRTNPGTGGVADGGNLPRLTNQDVADALAPRRIKPLTKQGERDAEWIEGFEEGIEWESTFRPNREAELVAHGVLIPTDRPGIFRVGRRR